MKGPLLPLLCVMLLAGCDVVDAPIPPATGDGGGTATDTLKRRVLLEEFTGHHCNNCPASHEVSAQLDALYGDRLVLVGIHAISNFNSSLIAPASPPNSDGSYATDFRTTEGQAWANSFSVLFLPTGMVNRTMVNNSITIGSGGWSTAVADMLSQNAECDVWVSDLQHNSGTNTVSATVKVAVLQTVTGTHNLTVDLTEDHITDWQLNSVTDIPDYDHRHVFRKCLNSAWGTLSTSLRPTWGTPLRPPSRTFRWTPPGMRPTAPWWPTCTTRLPTKCCR